MRPAAERTTADLIADQAVAHEASVCSRSSDDILLDIQLRRPSGKTIPYRLRVTVDSDRPLVREDPPDRLPTFCPDRHINVGGYFCLEFSREDALIVSTADGAEKWWARLIKFLSLQETATVLKRWPTNNEWAHGDAAPHQAKAERCAAALGPRFETALARRRLHAKRGRNGFIELHVEGRKLFSVHEAARRVATLRQLCFCGSGRVLICCGDHTAQAAELAFALLDWDADEQAFWNDVRALACCGRMTSCPLASSGPEVRTENNPSAETENT